MLLSRHYFEVVCNKESSITYIFELPPIYKQGIPLEQGDGFFRCHFRCLIRLCLYVRLDDTSSRQRRDISIETLRIATERFGSRESEFPPTKRGFSSFYSFIWQNNKLFLDLYCGFLLIL